MPRRSTTDGMSCASAGPNARSGSTSRPKTTEATTRSGDTSRPKTTEATIPQRQRPKKATIAERRAGGADEHDDRNRRSEERAEQYPP